LISFRLLPQFLALTTAMVERQRPFLHTRRLLRLRPRKSDDSPDSATSHGEDTAMNKFADSSSLSQGRNPRAL
jgi:hypothetical protein